MAGPEKILKDLQLMDRAASSISDGDIVGSMIMGCVFTFFPFILFLLCIIADRSITM